MYSNSKHRGFESWVLSDKDLVELLEIMNDRDDTSQIKITFMCKNSVRIYESLEESRTDENSNEDPIECVHLEVVVPQKGKRELDLHYVGIKPSSATISVTVTEQGENARSNRDKIVRRVRRLKPWWSWISELEFEKGILTILVMIFSFFAILQFGDALGLQEYSTSSSWLIGGFALYAVMQFLVWLCGIRAFLTRARMAIFPQGLVLIGEGHDRFKRTLMLQKTFGFIGSASVMAAISIAISVYL